MEEPLPMKHSLAFVFIMICSLASGCAEKILREATIPNLRMHEGDAVAQYISPVILFRTEYPYLAFRSTARPDERIRFDNLVDEARAFAERNQQSILNSTSDTHTVPSITDNLSLGLWFVSIEPTLVVVLCPMVERLGSVTPLLGAHPSVLGKHDLIVNSEFSIHLPTDIHLTPPSTSMMPVALLDLTSSSWSPITVRNREGNQDIWETSSPKYRIRSTAERWEFECLSGHRD
jgi:hypothetical protein